MNRAVGVAESRGLFATSAMLVHLASSMRREVIFVSLTIKVT